ncbi:DsbA family protein [Zavarzinia sp. CC-PAN008]|uniref:DsbA family protein n=1 Tax=Zavarzinia sp. CC-PAN008 TaxID=3243332 RepID=UPI003F74366A
MRIVVLLLALFAFSTPVLAEPQFNEAQRKEIGELVRGYLLEHPEVLEEAINILQTRREQQQADQAKGAIVANRAALTRDANAPVAGNPDGDITIVEFFDFRCGYCRSSHPTIQQLLKEDPRIRLVYRDFPILGPESELASRAAVASIRQGKYAVFHDALMEAPPQMTLESILAVAAKVGLDVDRLKADMVDPRTEKIINDTAELAAKVGIRATPSFVVGDTLIPGAIELKDLKEVIAHARASCTDQAVC